MRKFIFIRSKKITSLIAALSVLLTTVFSAVPLNAFLTSAAESISYWNGAEATAFAGGEGTSEKPYLIENGGQLFKAVSELGKKGQAAAYYKITADIYLNKDYENYADWGTAAPTNNWLLSAGDFIGHLDGDFHKIYGLYSSKSGGKNGLIPSVNSGATVKNLILQNAYVADSGNDVGTIVGAVYGASSVESCLVYDVSVKGAKNVGGIVGTTNANGSKISNCGAYSLTLSGSNAGGVLGASQTADATVESCFSAGKYIFGNSNKITCSGCYTDIRKAPKAGVTKVDNSEMQGSSAVSNMGLSTLIWKATEGYPVLYKTDIKIWDGTAATAFAGGNGTEDDPYQIETASQLYKAIKEHGQTNGSAAYYLITKDIYLNENYADYLNWGTAAPANNWRKTADKTAFAGHIDGGLHTVYGLYINRTSGSDNREGFIGVMNGGSVSNLIFANAYVYSNRAMTGVVVGGISGGTNTLSGIIVRDSYAGDATTDVIGGIVGTVNGNAKADITHCGSYNLTMDSDNLKGGIVGKTWSCTVSITDSYSVGLYPESGGSSGLSCSAVSSDIAGARGDVAKRDTDSMKGTGAVANTGLNAAYWKDTESYPTLKLVQKENKGDVWTGVKASKFAGGSGTMSDPYLIETGSQLYKAVSELGKKGTAAAYYKVTADIYLNKDYENYADWGTTAPENNWLAITSNADFIGHIDGDNHTVYGLYTKKNAWRAGLIERINGGSVRDLNLANSYVYCKDGTVGGIVGMAYDGTVISRCRVYNAVIVDQSKADAGAIVGAVRSGVTITACASYDVQFIYEGRIGGILGRAWSSALIRESFSVGNFPLGDHTDIRRVTCLNVYTDNNSITKGGVKVLDAADMKGSNALVKMPLNDIFWKADSEGYPVYADYVNGTKGEIWSGKIAKHYVDGDGTKENPYLIETGEQLYKMVYENCVPGNISKYYKLTADIRLNNTTGDNWYEKSDVNKWHIVKSYSQSFAGKFDGDGHMVSGIYTENDSNIQAYAGLIPVLEMGSSVKNVGVTDSYITTASVAENFSGGIVGWIDDWDSGNAVTQDRIPVISNCFVDRSVTIGGYHCGGILSGVAAPVLVENCYFIGRFKKGGACIIGNIWTKGSKVSHCYAATDTMSNFASGQSTNTGDLEYEACYNFGRGSGSGFSFVSLYDIRGEKAKQTMDQLDFENIWKTVDGGTPVLRVFGDKAENYSHTSDVYSTVSFVSNVTGMSIEPITGVIDSPIKLPQPKREGYVFEGWYVYVELQCEYTDTTYPFIDLTLYAKWEPAGVAQDFESYPNTEYDLGSDYVYFRPGVTGYDADKVYSGNKSLKRMGDSSERQDFLVKYEDEIEVGKEYTISFRMMTETEGASGKVSMLHATWPDIAEPVKGKEVTIAEYSNLSVGEWKQYKYTFTAQTPWITLRTDGNTILYFDDILIYPNK